MQLSKERATGAIVYFAIALLMLKLLISPSLDGEEEELVQGNPLSYACDIGILLCCMLSIGQVHKRFQFIYMSFVVGLFSFSVSTYLATGEFISAVKSVLRLFSPLFFFALLSSYFYDKPGKLERLSLYFMAYIMLLTVAGLLLLPPSHNRTDGLGGGVWWPSYFNGIHTTTYVAVSFFYISYALWCRKVLSNSTLLFVFSVVFLSVAFGWGIRTTTLSMIVLGLSWFYFNKLKSINYTKFIVFGLSVFFLLSALVFFGDWEKLNSLSSGRLAMYEFKVGQLSDNTIQGWLIGNGAGSDLVITDVWWWAPKGAHNDFITFLVEGGMVYFLMSLFLVFKLYNLFVKSSGKALVLAVFVTSLVSNGFLVRPLALYVMIFSLSLIYVMDKNYAKSA